MCHLTIITQAAKKCFPSFFSLFSPQLRHSRYKNIKPTCRCRTTMQNLDRQCKLILSFYNLYKLNGHKMFVLEFTQNCFVSFCNQLQMAISRGGSIANIQHLPIIFHHLSYLTAILCKLRKHFSTLSFLLDTAQSPSHFSSSGEDFVWYLKT